MKGDNYIWILVKLLLQSCVSLPEDNGIKGCSGMKKAELAQFLIKYVEEHVTAVSVENKKNVSEPKDRACGQRDSRRHRIQKNQDSTSL